MGVTWGPLAFKLIAGLCAVVVLVAMALIGGMSNSKLKMWLPGIMIATAFLVQSSFCLLCCSGKGSVSDGSRAETASAPTRSTRPTTTEKKVRCRKLPTRSQNHQRDQPQEPQRSYEPGQPFTKNPLLGWLVLFVGVLLGSALAYLLRL